MPHYVKKLWEKNYWRKLRSVRVFSKNCASNFFGALAKEWQLECKTSFYQRTKRMLLLLQTVSISEPLRYKALANLKYNISSHSHN
jgi:hypothetical protein